MPVIKSAIKTLRQDIRRKAVNTRVRSKVKTALDQVRKSPKSTPAQLSQAFSVLDRAAKTGVIHHKKASRLKSRLSRFQKTKSK